MVLALVVLSDCGRGSCTAAADDVREAEQPGLFAELFRLRAATGWRVRLHSAQRAHGERLIVRRCAERKGCDGVIATPRVEIWGMSGHHECG